MAGKLIVFNDNGAWCWYQDARVIVDTTNGKMLIGSIANKAGIGGADRNGNIELTTYDWPTANRSCLRSTNLSITHKFPVSPWWRRG